MDMQEWASRPRLGYTRVAGAMPPARPPHTRPPARPVNMPAPTIRPPASRQDPASRGGEDAPMASDQAYEAIIDLILTHQLRLGERTSVVQLADRLSLGRTPVKEAIARLEAEGLLSVAGRSGTTVNTIDAATARQLFALRRHLENFAVEDAVRGVTEPELARLRVLLSELKQSTASVANVYQDAARYVKANVRFHAALVAAAHNPTLDRLYAQVQMQAQIVTYLYHLGVNSNAIGKRQREHAAILKALEARDADRLRALLQDHACATEASVIAALQARGAA